MDDAPYNPPNPSMFGNIDYFMDQLLDEGCWLQTADGSNYSQPGPSTSRGLSFSPYPLPILEADSSSLTSANPQSSNYQEERERWFSPDNPSPQGCSSKAEEAEETQSQDQKAITLVTKSPAQVHNLCWEGDEINRILWIAPKANSGPSTSVKDRLMMAIYRLSELNRNRDVLIQIWVPIKRGLKSFLTTVKQPFFYQPTNRRLIGYRDVSEQYEFLADEDTKEALGLPGRVFLGKAPEWTPDVRFFRQEEYPRINYAHKYDVRGSIALPVFERGSGSCLGVVEIIMTTEKINYRPEVESVCRALESVNLRSSEILNTSQEQARKGSYEAVRPEIVNVLRTVCDTHDLPLAQTWAPCSQQGKGGCWHSDKNALCVSTLDSACYVRDQQVLEFHKACSEHHLLRPRGGIIGKAFETNQPCFATDVTEFSKADYPLSHHAKISGLRGAVAIRLSSIYQESSDYVLEFYLPLDFKGTGLSFHGRIWQSVLLVIQQQCRSLHFVTRNNIEQKSMYFPGKLEVSTSGKREKEESSTYWFSDMIDSQRKGKEIGGVSLGFGEEEPSEEFKVMTSNWSNDEQVFSDCGNIKEDCRSLKGKGAIEGVCGSSYGGGRLPLGARKAGEKRRTKSQKTISLQVLRQYFAGSLKDAAKSIGVCPTTLKRICRQHGITRWPSRKIKKVGHSLRKLQLVIDSVQGAEGSIQLSSFYSKFPELNSPNNNTSQPKPTNQFSSLTLTDQSKHHLLTTSNSPSTSSSQTSTSSHCFSSGVKISSPGPTRELASTTEDPSGSLKRARSEAELQALSKKEHSENILERSQSNKSLLPEHSPLNEGLLPPLSRIPKSGAPLRDVGGGVFKAKATFGDEKVRFTILPNMGFKELQQEIGKRFNLEDLSKIGIKYLDDDKEWVLLTCDDDLEECIDIHKSSGSHTIKLTLSPLSSLGGSFGSSGLS